MNNPHKMIFTLACPLLPKNGYRFAVRRKTGAERRFVSVTSQLKNALSGRGVKNVDPIRYFVRNTVKHPEPPAVRGERLLMDRVEISDRSRPAFSRSSVVQKGYVCEKGFPIPHFPKIAIHR